MTDIAEMTDLEVDKNILELKDKFGEQLFIPVHHYQRDEIVQFADYTGDSLELSRVSASSKARFIVFCGVYFMAEIARILSPPERVVFIPQRSAGCPLADFAMPGDVEQLWEALQEVHPKGYIPVTYANSHAGVKAFCGRNNGFMCTSSNVDKIFRWILEKGKRIFFIPDRNLGFNTASTMGMGDQCLIVGPQSVLDREVLKKKKIILWGGFCVVHKVFNINHVNYWRKKDPEIKIIVHPECDPDVVEASDYTGSTSKIKKTVENSPAGSKWVIGTEFNLVNRLKVQNPDKFIEPLDKSICTNMSKIRRRDLLSTLLSIEMEDFSEQVTLPWNLINDAKLAIERMLELS
ncbi:MAG: quinolinate synthase NadA [Spirochaetota bacterium]